METTSVSTVRPLTNARRDTILGDILDSYIASANQDAAETALVTKRIARRRRASVQQVAAVRAALTSGRYGEMKSLLSARRRALKAAAK